MMISQHSQLTRLSMDPDPGGALWSTDESLAAMTYAVATILNTR